MATITGYTKAGADALFPNVQPHGIPGRWTLDFSDEFTGTTLDMTKWPKTFEGETVNTAVCRTANISVSNGLLRLQVSSATEGACIASNSGDSVVGQGYLFQVGSYIEFRAYFPGDLTGAFNWPAVWTSGGNWPTNGEYDIAEVLSAIVTANYHYGVDSGSGHKQKNLQQPPGTWRAGWHQFGVYRRTGWADFWWDGVLVRSVATTDQGGGQTILINNGLTGTAILGAAGALLVDHVRVWKRATEPAFQNTYDTFSAGLSTTGMPLGWTQQGTKGAVGVNAAQQMTLTTPAVAYGASLAALWTAVEPVAGCDLVVELGFSSTAEQYHKVGVRCDHLRGDDLPFNGYFVEVQPNGGQWLLVKMADGTKTVLATVTGYTFSATVATKVRIQALAVSSTQTVRARLWQVGASEPSTWGASVADSSVTLGRPFIGAQNGNAATAVTVTVDNAYVVSA